MQALARRLEQRSTSREVVAIGALWVLTATGGIAMVAVVGSMLAGLGEGPGLAVLIAVVAADAIAFATMGLLIATRRPGNRVAWVLAVAGSLIVLAFIGYGGGAYRYAEYGAGDALGGLLAVVGAVTLGPALFTAVSLLAILFPDGLLPGPRWRLPVGVASGLVLLSSLAYLVQPGPVNTELPDNPLGIESDVVRALAGPAGASLILGLIAGAALAIMAVATRFRRSSGPERQQVKWLLGAVTSVGMFLPLSFIGGATDFDILDVLAIASLALVPVSVGVAVLRYRLYEIDRLISRTLGWAIVTGLLAAVFTAGVIGLQAALAGFTQGQTLAVASSTLLAFALFQPLRRGVQRAVDRRFDRARYDGQRTVDAFAGRLRDGVDLGQIRAGTLATVGETVRPAHAAVWLRQGGAR